MIQQRDGSEAVSNVNANPDKYDLIFMDIIMPVFDGVSATACIRMVQPRVPIIAMTSNIRGEDIATYFQWGMNDVLAKPFTKDGMVRILKKHLSYLLKNPPGPGEDLGHNGGMQAPAGYTSAGMTMGPGGQSGMATAGGQMKFETTPIQSPAATTASWHSPGGGQMTQASPNLDATSYMNAVNVNGSSQMPITPGGTHRPQFQGGMVPHVGTPPIRGMQDGMGMEGPPEKRQRMYGPGQVQYGQ